MDRRHFLTALVGSLVIGWSLFAVAEEPKSAALLQTLPADGSWSSFNVTVNVNGKELVLAAKAASVGQIIYDGKKCRCIE